MKAIKWYTACGVGNDRKKTGKKEVAQREKKKGVTREEAERRE